MYNDKLVCSTYPAIYDADTYQEYIQSGASVNLIVHDLNSGVQETIATSITKEFDPEWIDENTLEYNDPNGSGRITKYIP